MNVNNIVVTGKSGAGKQPRIDVLVKEYGLSQLSTGNIFRAYLGTYKSLGLDLDLETMWDKDKDDFVDDSIIIDKIKPSTDIKSVNLQDAVLGLKATRFVDGGLFVPDSITNALFEAAFMKNDGKGMVLDGYPRTTEQGEFLLHLVEKAKTTIDLIVLVENENEAIINRTIGRRICKNCGKVYHVEFKPPRDGKFCTNCDTEVIQRSDDTREKIRTRLQEFENKTLGAINFLQSKGVEIVNVPGNLPKFTDEIVRESVMSKVAPILSK
jgi:adenylate kinase